MPAVFECAHLSTATHRRAVCFSRTAGAVLLAAAAVPVNAQTDATAPPLEEVVVTALKRERSLQDVPASVVVIDGDSLAKANVTTALDLPAIAPGILIQVAPGGIPVAAIRGIGSNASNNSFDQSVALFVDGVFAARGRDYASSLFDIADIQVLKGGQSAVLGKNTTIGAISLTTQRPTRDWEYSVGYSHEFALGSNTADVVLNIPVTATLAMRASGHYADLGGWQENTLIDTADSPRTRTQAGRLSLRWQPTDELDWNLSYQQERFENTGTSLYVAGDSQGVVTALAAAAGDPNFTAAFNDRYRASPRPGLGNDSLPNESKRLISTLEYSWAGYSLTALSAYLRSDGEFFLNFNALPTSPVIFHSDRVGADTFSQEIRLASPRLGAFDFLVGALYYDDDYDFDFGLDSIAPMPVQGAEYTDYAQRTEAASGFASATWHLSPALEATGALRYTSEDRSAHYSRTIIRPGALTAALFRPFAPVTLSRSGSDLDGSATLQYRFDNSPMVYASYSKGTKSGGFANNPNDPTLLRPDGTRAAEYGDEVARTVELGAKIGSAAASYLNATLFEVNVADFQTSLFSGTNFIVKNVDIRSRGVEAEGALLATDNLRFRAAVTYVSGVNKAPSATERRELVRSPKWSGIAGLNYLHEIGPRWTLEADANVEFRSGIYFQDNPLSPVPRSPGFGRVGLRLALSDMQNGLEIALVGRNLTDRRVANYGTGLFPSLPGAYLASSEPPRTIALQVLLKQ